MRKIETRLARLEVIMNRKAGPVINFSLIFFGASERMPKEKWSRGNVTFEPVLYDDLPPVGCSGNA